MTTPEIDEGLASDNSPEFSYSQVGDVELGPTPLPAEDGSMDDVAFEELTLSELLEQFLHAPRITIRAIRDIAGNRDVQEVHISTSKPIIDATKRRPRPYGTNRESIQLTIQIVAFLLAVWGVRIWGIDDAAHPKDRQLTAGMPYVLIAIFFWISAFVYMKWPAIRSWQQRILSSNDDSALETGPVKAETPPLLSETWARIHVLRGGLGVGAVFFAWIAWFNTGGNHFTFWGFWGWVLSVVLIIVAFAPSTWYPLHLWQRLQEGWGNFRFKGNWTLLALVAIMLVGTYFRLHDLDGMPPQMTSDHKEKLLDAQRVLEGEYSVFFPNNGGREGFQMYALAALSYLPGLGINHFSLKMLAVIESLVTLPVLWWMGREVIGERDRRLGNVVGLILMALVAVSYWHVAVTRVALRIILTPLVAALLVIFLSRAMRYNRRGDFILAGIVLGGGLYTYQAARMLPVVVVAGVGMMLLLNLRNGRVFRRYLSHLAVLVSVALVIFVPLFRFAVDSPESFWMRTSGRVLGESMIEDVDDEGNTILREATTNERQEAFKENIAILTDNILRAFLMYSWQGDEAWFHGVSHHPAMDIFTGGLLVVGVGAWITLIVYRRDPVFVLIPLVAFIMLLPSALSIGRPSENPSATRSSGSLPAVYLIAALPLAVMTTKTRHIIDGRAGVATSVGMAALVMSGAYWANSTLYFDDYREKYSNSTWPYREPGQMLRGFAMSDGGYGNAFMISYDYWWDSVIVGMEGGILDWPNGINTGNITVEEFVRDAFYCEGKLYPVDPDRDLLFFYHYEDEEHEEKLREWFPSGYATLVVSYKEDYNYKIYRVPALGVEGFFDFTENYTEPPECSPREFLRKTD